MDYKEIIDKLVRELSFRVGIPNIHNKEHQSIMSEILSEWGEYDIKETIFNHLNEKDETFTAKNKESGETAVFKSKEARDNAIKAGTHEPIDKKVDEPKKKDSSKISAKDFADRPDVVKKKKEKEDGGDKKDKKQQANGYIGDKDKSVKEGNPSETEEYKKEPKPNDKEFQKRNEKHKNPIPPPPIKLDGIIKNPKFPKRYITMLERMVNSKLTTKTKKWEHFSDIAGGQGQIKAQFGELLTMIGSTLDDDEFDQLMNTLEEYEKNLVSQNPDVFKKKNKKGKIVDNPGSRIMDSSWLKSARNNRKAILNRLEKQYGKGTKIIGAAWDVKNEVEAMGMSDYDNNKGFSTDCYFKVQKPDGEQVLDEVSLKKSVLVNFLNSGAGIFSEWDTNLPDEINQEVYREKARKRNIDWITQNIEKVNKFLNSPEGEDIKNLMESKKLTFEEALEGNSRDKQNVLFKTIQLMSKTNESAKSIVDQDNREHSEFTEKAINSITENDKIYEGMLKEIRSEFPLKAVSDGEETMAIGPNSLDKETMKSIFGTDNYDEIKEKLVAKPGPPPFIGYRVDTGDEIIPVAKIVIREDGRGYGGQFKFEMVLHKDFAKRLEQAQKEIYGTE